MSFTKYKTLEQYMDHLKDEHRPVIKELKRIFSAEKNAQLSVRRDCLHVRFANGMWCYVNTRSQKYPVLGVSRGAWMVRKEPLLGALFDEVKKVVGKIVCKDLQAVKEKGVEQLIIKIAQYPAGIGVLED